MAFEYNLDCHSSESDKYTPVENIQNLEFTFETESVSQGKQPPLFKENDALSFASHHQETQKTTCQNDIAQALTEKTRFDLAQSTSILPTLGRQVAAPLLNSLLSLNAIQAGYITTFAEYQANAHAPIFEGDKTFKNRYFQNLYDPSKPLGDAASQILVGKNSFALPLSQDELQLLRQRGAAQMSATSWGLTGSQLTRLAPNLIGLSQDRTQSSSFDNLTLLLDTTSLASNITDSTLFSVGAQSFGKGDIPAATSRLLSSQKLNVVSSALVLGTGTARLLNEFDRAIHGEPMRHSTLLYGAMDTGNGMVGIVYSTNLLREASKATTHTDKAQALMGFTHMPANLQTGMRVMGSLGSATGIVTNSMQLYQSVADPTLSYEQKQEKQISGVLGLTGSSAILAGMLLVTPALMPVSGAFILVGTIMLVGQSMYDYRKEISQFGR